MTRVWAFLMVAVVVEAVAIPVHAGKLPTSVMEAVIGLTTIYVLYLTVRGWQKQSRLQIPPVMTGKEVRKRHWHLF